MVDINQGQESTLAPTNRMIYDLLCEAQSKLNTVEIKLLELDSNIVTVQNKLEQMSV